MFGVAGSLLLVLFSLGKIIVGNNTLAVMTFFFLLKKTQKAALE